ncbi:ATP-dependent Clp protease ATP-binding subunit ClpC [Flavobacterium nitrogenifigens]|uniref:ATP-dependent Clp protease ATP-binding subunit ClpC n=2 Tax=Flavobacterium TaxID=237 RepID=A0A7W7IWZ9_9FLAO|nr:MULTISPECIES: AAA family ATPase [Flavobacterium]MBB4801868.1 ATP-dependent Clp protease ATP-binding subunit ClpC [Flavobacterium nitrogenifigens]MBB6386826.1 ATP-dependent Clp protease ATP-binding subunit ClpC [Flavobacterium notoginsengisoli]
MRSELLFYEKDDFFDYKELKYSEGYSIASISKFIKDNELIYDLDSESTIIDLSVLSEYVSLQLLPEQVLPLFDDEIIFIADKKHKKLLSYELRFVFEYFNDVEKSYLKKEVNLNSDSDEIKPQKRHNKIIDLDNEDITIFFQNFREKLYGHPKFKDDLEQEINTFRIFNKLGEHKILSLFLMGDSGVGKTEVARTMFNCLNGKKKLAKINFGNYSNEFSLSSLIGSARGYTGSDDGEIFMKVRDTDVGILLIDEFEKSNASLFNYFLDVLESGKMTSSLGDEIDLNGFIIVFTSNITKEDFSKRISPELRSRFNYKCMFTVLSNKDKEKYIEFRVGSLIKKVKQEYNIEFPENTINYFTKLINVSKYKNMRDINKQIKKVFLKYIQDNNYIDIEHEEVDSVSKFSVGRKIINLFR